MELVLDAAALSAEPDFSLEPEPELSPDPEAELDELLLAPPLMELFVESRLSVR